MSKNCLYCYTPLTKNTKFEFHENCSLNFFGTNSPPQLPYSLDQMSALAKNVVERSVTIPGVQPKLSLSLINEVLQDVQLSRLTVVGILGGNYILKPPSEHYAELPQNEHLTMKIAEVFGIKTVESSLIRLQSGELSYITKRIDRKADGEKIHMLDMFQITAAFDKYKSSMEKVGKALHTYSNNTLLDKMYFFELSIFIYLTGNNDMHLKNFSMINMQNNWSLAPAYDLLNVAIVNPDDEEELALTLEGKKKKLQRIHFENFGKALDLNSKQITSVFNRFQKLMPIANELIDKSFLSKKFQKKYKELMASRYWNLFE